MSKTNKNAISLIVLVVTILVLAILASAVIISLSKGDIMGQASSTVFKSDMANYKEAYELYVTKKTIGDITFNRDSLNVTNADNPNEFKEIFGDKVPDKYKDGLKVVNGKLVYETDDGTENAVLKELNMQNLEVISKTQKTENGKSPYLGYYVKIGDEYGIIFADLAISERGTWGTSNSNSFSYGSEVEIDILKDYVVSSQKYTDRWFGENYVLEAVEDTNKEERFYVMALKDITSTQTTNNLFTWYAAAYNSSISNYSEITSTAFGKGKTNTETLISEWNDNESKQDTHSSYLDVWGVIKDGWFIPSKDEWAAFAVYLESLLASGESLKTVYSSKFGLKERYWSSCFGRSYRHAWYIHWRLGTIYSDGSINQTDWLRLAATY